MPFVAATRAIGRAGLFTFSVLRASKPTADFFRELVREIYKIGVQYNSVEETLAQLGMPPNREPGRRAVPNRYAA